jgi:hypothetical protein
MLRQERSLRLIRGLVSQMSRLLDSLAPWSGTLLLLVYRKFFGKSV